MDKVSNSSQNPVRQQAILEESSKIFQLFSSLSSDLSDPALSSLSTVQSSFSSLYCAFSSLSSSLELQINNYQTQSLKIKTNCSNIRQSSSRVLAKSKEKMLEKEKEVHKTQESLKRSLGLIKDLWDQNLKSMKKSLKEQRVLKNHLILQVKKMDSEMSQEIQAKTIDKELISHESAFEVQSETNANVLGVGLKTIEHNNSSFEFEKCMAELEYRNQNSNGNISIEKSYGGWKSEYESENESFGLNPSEIKQAIKVLKNANLLNSKGGNMLDKLMGLMKSPGNSQKIELLLQLHNLQIKPSPSAKGSQKPPLKVPKLKKNDLVATPKAGFIFTEDLAKTILSSENPLSARQPEDGLENILEELSKADELKDVQLEDLLKIPFIIPDLQIDQVPAPPEERNDYLSCLSVLSPSEVKLASPVKKQMSGFDYQSTGISSHSGLRSRITLKTGGSDVSQKVFTPNSGVEESFKYYNC